METNRSFVSNSCAINSDGTRVAFTSFASNLVAGDTNVKWDVFVWDGPSDVVTVPVKLSGLEIE